MVIFITSDGSFLLIKLTIIGGPYKKFTLNIKLVSSLYVIVKSNIESNVFFLIIKLEILDCYHNQLTCLPYLLHTNLRQLNCHNNQLTTLPLLNTSLKIYCNYTPIYDLIIDISTDYEKKNMNFLTNTNYINFINKKLIIKFL